MILLCSIKVSAFMSCNMWSNIIIFLPWCCDKVCAIAFSLEKAIAHWTELTGHVKADRMAGTCSGIQEVKLTSDPKHTWHVPLNDKVKKASKYFSWATLFKGTFFPLWEGPCFRNVIYYDESCRKIYFL